MNTTAQNPLLTTYQAPYRAPLLASLMLILTLLQGSSATLTLAFRSSFASELLITLVTVLWLAMYLTATAGLIATQGINWLTWMVRYRLPLVILVAGTALSTAWSVDANLTMERSIHLIGTTILALYIGFSLPLTRILKTSAITLGLLMLASVFSALFLPSMGLEEYEGQMVWAGVMASKNTLGFWAAVSALLLVSLSCWPITMMQRLFYLALAGASMLCLYYSVSATSVLSLLSAAVIMLYLYTTQNLRLGMLASILLALFAATLIGMAFLFIDTAELIGRSGDLTGRGDVWKQTWELILARPFTGYGYGTIWYPTDDSVSIQQSLTDFSWTVYHAHNGLLQIASEIGLPLAAIALVMIVQQLVELIYCQYQRQQPGVLFVLGFTIALLVSNYSEARLLVNRELYWIFFLALPISMLQQITLTASAARGFRVPFTQPLDINDRLTRSRERITQVRSLKKRLNERRRITIINQTDSKESPLTDSLGNGLFAAETPRNSRHHHEHGGDAMKRKLARQKFKADGGQT